MALGGLVVCSTLATAQDSTNAPDKKGGTRGMSADQLMERYTEQLSLTDEQKPKVKTVIEDSMKKRRELFRDSSLDQEQKREKFRTVMDDQNKKMKEILTPDQFTKYQEMQEKMKKGKKKAE
jgi:Spy/CpxP family protein refolding chaperone